MFPSSSSHPASSNSASVLGPRGGCRAREKRERGSRNHEQVQGTRHHVARINDSRPRRRYEARKHFPFFSRPDPPSSTRSSGTRLRFLLEEGDRTLLVAQRQIASEISRLILFERLFLQSRVFSENFTLKTRKLL